MARLSIWSSLFLIAALGFAFAHAGVAADSGAQIFRRENYGCVQNCGEPLACNCKSYERCELTAQTCLSCPTVICTPVTRPKPKVPNGAVAGGALGGVIVASSLGFFLWRRCVKKREQRLSMAATAAEKESDFGMLKSARASTHTVASIASTVRTRASNVIQIAYIPGVTNRSGPSTPAHLAPPIPPLPYSDSPTGSQFPRSPNSDIQFAASDLLRGSMCTVDNRSSIATTIYGGNAIVSQPNIIRAGKAAVVVVKGGSTATSSTGSPTPGSPDDVPPVPPLFTTVTGPSTHGKGKNPDLEAGPPSPAFSVGSTFLNRMKTDSDTTVSDTPKLRVIPGRSRIQENHRTSYNSDDSELVPGHRGNVVESQCSSCITDDIVSPFSDANSVMIGTPTTTRNSQRLSGVPLRSPRVLELSKPSGTVSPFDDLHSVDEHQ